MPKRGRTKVEAEAVATREQAEMVLAEIARLQVAQEMLKNAHANEISQIGERYGERIERFSDQIKSRTKLLNSWAKANTEEFEKGKKSIELVSGRIGFRTNPPSVKCVKGETFEKVVEMLKKLDLTRWLRVVTELDKETILADHRDEKVTDGELKNFGLYVSQTDAFFVEPKLEAEKAAKEEEALAS